MPKHYHIENSKTIKRENSADPDGAAEVAQFELTHLDLHCLQN